MVQKIPRARETCCTLHCCLVLTRRFRCRAGIFFLGAVGLVSARLGIDAAKHEHLRQELMKQKAAKAAEKAEAAKIA
jgi:hypothetical protein